MNVSAAPSPLTARERAIYWIVLLICAASRFLAIARSLWDWDEALFCLGMRSYDVASHHPHPPGFPVYIAAAKIARLFVNSDFHALQAVNLIAAVLVFPAMFMLARELRLKFTTSVIASALLAFFPNVWFFGGTGFSDVTSITLVIYAVAFLFRGCRDSNATSRTTEILRLSCSRFLAWQGAKTKAARVCHTATSEDLRSCGPWRLARSFCCWMNQRQDLIRPSRKT